MAGVIAKCDGLPVRRADAALRAEDEKGFADRLARIPTHACVLTETEDVAARSVAEHLLGQRQAARGAGGFGLDLKDGFACGGEEVGGQTHDGAESKG